MTDTSPIGGTGSRNFSPTNLDALRRRILSLETRLNYLERSIRNPPPLQMSQVSNAAQMQQAQAGHAPVYQPYPGVSSSGFTPSPVLASLVFNMPTALTLGTSNPLHSRYWTNIVGISADLATYSSEVTFTVAKNGTTIATVTMDSISTGLIPVDPSVVLGAYDDLVTVTTTDVGSGNAGLVVHVELAVDVNNPPPL